MGDSSFGLQHILERRTEDFINKGFSKEEAEEMALDFIENKIPEIIIDGNIVENSGVYTIILKQNNSEFRVGLSKGFHGRGDNVLIITSYKKKTNTLAHRISTKLRIPKN